MMRPSTRRAGPPKGELAVTVIGGRVATGSTSGGMNSGGRGLGGELGPVGMFRAALYSAISCGFTPIRRAAPGTRIAASIRRVAASAARGFAAAKACHSGVP